MKGPLPRAATIQAVQSLMTALGLPGEAAGVVRLAITANKVTVQGHGWSYEQVIVDE